MSCRFIANYINGNVAIIGNYKNGKQEGEWKLYRENGKLAAIENYKNGKKEGEWKFYHKNGKLKIIGNYKNGKLEGEWKYYYENGTLEAIVNYKNGERNFYSRRFLISFPKLRDSNQVLAGFSFFLKN